MTALSGNGEVCIFTNSSVDIVVDLVGVYVGPDDSLVNQLSLTDANGQFLVPDQQFEVDGLDYTIRCDGETDLGLRLGLAPRVTARVNDEAVERDPVEPDLMVAIAPDEAHHRPVAAARCGGLATRSIACPPTSRRSRSPAPATMRRGGT